MAAKVRAIRAGFYDSVRRHPGDIFVLRPGQKPGAWMELVADVPAPKPEKQRVKKEPQKEPDTFSEISKTYPTPPGVDLV